MKVYTIPQYVRLLKGGPDVATFLRSIREKVYSPHTVSPGWILLSECHFILEYIKHPSRHLLPFDFPDTCQETPVFTINTPPDTGWRNREKLLLQTCYEEYHKQQSSDSVYKVINQLVNPNNLLDVEHFNSYVGEGFNFLKPPSPDYSDFYLGVRWSSPVSIYCYSIDFL